MATQEQIDQYLKGVDEKLDRAINRGAITQEQRLEIENTRGPIPDQIQAMEELNRGVIAGTRGTIGQFLTSTGEFEPSQEVAGLAEVGFGGQEGIGLSTAQNLQIATGLLVTADPKAQIDIIRDAVPEAQFRTTKKGETIVTIGDNSFVLNKPGISNQDVVTSIAQLLQFAGPARLASLAKSAFTRIGSMIAADTAVSVAQDVAAGALGSEQGIDAGKAIVSGVGALAFQTGGEAFRAIKGSQQPLFRDLNAKAIEQARANSLRAEAAERATGVQLTAAQKIGLPKTLEMQSILTTLPGGIDDATVALGKINIQASNAVDDFIFQFTKRDGFGDGAAKFRTAAAKSIERERDIRRQATSPLFNQAFEQAEQRTAQGQFVNTSSVIGNINQRIQEFPTGGQVANTLNKVSRFIREASGKPNDLRRLQNVKKEIDLLLEKRGSKALGRTTSAELKTVRRDLVSVMEDFSPQFASARQEFARLSPPVQQLEEGLIGRFAKTQDPELKSIGTRLFSAAETDPRVLKSTKKIIDQVDPDAFNDLFGVELQRRVGLLDLPENILSTPEFTNVPRALRKAIFGKNNKQRQIIFDSLEGDRLANAKFLEDVLRRASKGFPTGSPTAMREQIIKQDIARRGVIGTVLDVTRTFLRRSPEDVLSRAETKQITTNSGIIANMLFDTSYTGDITKVRKLFVQGKQGEAARSWAELLIKVPPILGREISGFGTEVRAAAPGFLTREAFTEQEALQ